MATRRTWSSMLAVVAVAGAVLVGCAAPVVGCDRYAAPTGDDAAAGTRAHPWLTPQHLAEALRPGQTGCLRAGAYPPGRDGYVLAIRSGRDITVRSAPGERARLKGIVMVAHGVTGARLSHLTITGTGLENTIKLYGANAMVEDSDVTNRLRGRSCMIIGSSVGGRAHRPVVRDNVFHDCGDPRNGNKDHGIYVARTDGGRITGNVFANPVAYAVQLYPDAQDVQVTRNLVRAGPDTVRGGIVIGGDSGHASSGNVVEHNLILGAVDEPIATYWNGPVGHDNRVRANCTSVDRLDCLMGW